MSVETPAGVLRQSIKHHNDPDTRDRYLDSYSSDVVVHGADVKGLAELRAFYRTVWEAVPDLTVSIDRVIADGDELAVRYSWSGTHAETDETVELDSGLTWYRFEDGEIVERWIAEGTGAAIREIVGPDGR